MPISPTQIKQRQQLCEDLVIACAEDNDILETLVDEYVYKCNQKEVEELEVLVNSVLGE